MRKLLFVLFISTFFVGFSQKKVNPRIHAAVSKKVDEIWANSKVPGLSLSIVLPNGEAQLLLEVLQILIKNFK